MNAKDEMIEIVGAGGGKKGGGKSADNTLKSTATARIVEAISEGPIVGLVKGYQSVYLDETPVKNADGSWNFDNVVLQQRRGNPDDAHLNGHGAVETVHSVETEVKQATGSVTRTITDQNTDAVRLIVRINSLFKVDDSGKAQTNTLHYEVQMRPFGGNWENVVTQKLDNEKCSSPVQIAHRFELPVGGHPWDIRVTRLTDDSNDDKDQSSMTFESFITLIEGRFTYPHTALVGMEVEAESMGQSVPERAYHVLGRIIDVPSNYDPVARTYTGLWDGQFKQAWTNNPAWIYLDLISNDRYGMGEFFSSAEVTNLKWRLYTIGQYCDQMIPSGFKDDASQDIMEPRFTFNGVIRDRQEAYHALETITTSFRGMGYWSLGQVFATADMPADPVKLVTPANVIDGRFGYSSTALKARHSVAIIRWNDPNDFYRPATEMVVNNEALAKFGWREKRLDFPGCTSRGLAHRYGKWALDVENTETETVEYKASFDHMDIAPGDIVSIADPRKAGVRMGGRIVSHSNYSATRDEIVLDSEIGLPAGSGNGAKIWLTKSNGELVELEIRWITSDLKHIRVDVQSEYSEPNSVFVVTATDVEPRQYRVISINEAEENIFQITALFHDPQKYARIEQNLSFDPIPYSRDVKATKVLNLSVDEIAYIDADGVARTKTSLTWQAPKGVIVREYAIQADTPTEVKRFVTSTKNTSVEIENLERGDHTFYVTTIDRLGRVSQPAQLAHEVVGTDPIATGQVSNLILTDADGSNEFFGRDVSIEWKNMFPSAINGQLAENLALYDYNTVKVYHAPTNTLLRNTIVRGNTFTYSFDHNTRDCTAAALSVGAARDLRFEVTVTSKRTNTSAPATLTVSNPVPGAIAPTVTKDAQTITVTMPTTADSDVRGMKVWIESNNSFNPNTTSPKFEGAGGFMTWVGTPGQTYYVRAGYYDHFDDTMSVSAAVSIQTDDIVAPTAPAVPTNLVLSTSLLENGMARVTATWDANQEADLSHYELSFVEGNGNAVTFTTSTTTKSWDIQPGTVVQVAVRAWTTTPLKSNYSTTVNLTAQADTTAPAIPVNIVVKGGFKGVWIEWSRNTESDLSHYEVKRKTTSTPPGPNWSPNFVTSSNTIYDGDFSADATVFYFVRAVDTSGNKSDWSAAFTASVQGSVDLTSEDISGLVGKDSLTENLILPEHLGALPSEGNYEGRVVILSTDGKIYRYFSGAWTSRVPTSDLQGQINSSQISSVSASLISGEISGDKIAQNAIDMSRLANGLQPLEIVDALPSSNNYEGRSVVLTSDGKIHRYHSGAWTSEIPTGDLSGQITTTQITNSSITTEKILGEAVTADKIKSNTITAAQIAAGTISATEIKAGSLDARVLDGSSFGSMMASGVLMPRVHLNQTTSLTYATIEPNTTILKNGEIELEIETEGTVGSFDVAIGDVITTTRPTALHDARGVTPVPFSWAGTKFAFDAWRYEPHTLCVYAPFEDGEITVTVDHTTNVVSAQPVVKGGVSTFTLPGNGKYSISSTVPILVTKTGTSAGKDNFVLSPLGKEVLGREGAKVGMDNTLSVLSNAYYHNAEIPFSVTAIGDGLGTTGEQGMPLEALGNEYLLAHDVSDYTIASVLPTTVVVEHFTGGSWVTYKTHDLTGASKSAPLSHEEGDPSGEDPTILTGPVRVRGDAPFYLRTNVATLEYQVIGWRREHRDSFRETAALMDYWRLDGKGKLNGGVISANTILADQIAAGAIGADELDVGAVEANHIAAGAITTDKMVVGNGGNLLESSNWTSDTETVSYYSQDSVFSDEHEFRIRQQGQEYAGKYYPTLEVKQTGITEGWGTVYLKKIGESTQTCFPANEGEWYDASCQVWGLRCDVKVGMMFRDENLGWLASFVSDTAVNTGNSFNPESWTRAWAKGQAPVGTRYVQLIFIKHGTKSESTSFLFGHKPMLAKTHEHASEPTPYAPSGATLISGSELMTSSVKADAIAAEAVTTDKLDAGAVSAAKIEAGAVGTDKLAARSVTASKIVATDTENLVPNGDFSEDAPFMLTAATGSGVVEFRDTESVTGGQSLLLRKTELLSTTSTSLTPDYLFPVRGEKEYWFETEAKTGGSPSGAGFFFVISWFDASKAFLSSTTVVDDAALDGSWLIFADKVAAPAGAAYAGYTITNHSTNSLVTHFYVDRVSMRRANAAELIVDGGITASHIQSNEIITNSANIGNGVITNAKIADATIKGAKIEDATIDSAKIADVEASKITISNESTLADWRKAGDLTKIDGGAISANTIDANKLTIGQRGVQVQKIVFSVNDGVLSWTTGAIRYVQDDGSYKYQGITAGSAPQYTNTAIHIYWEKDSGSLSTTVTPTDVITNDNRIALAVYNGGTSVTVALGRTIIDGDYIKTNTIDASHIKVDSIEADRIKTKSISVDQLALNSVSANELQSNAVKADKIEAGAVTADKLTVGSGVNLINNSDFRQGMTCWGVSGFGTLGSSHSVSIRPAGSAWAGNTFPVLEIMSPEDTESDGYIRVTSFPQSADGSWNVGYPVEGDKFYEISAKISRHYCKIRMLMQWFDETGAQIGATTVVTDNSEVAGSSTDPESWGRKGGIAQAPTNARYVRPAYQIYQTTSSNDAYLFVYKPLFGETAENAQLMTFAHGGTSVLDGGNIVTGSITAGMGLFSGPLQSTNFASGSEGWAINANGTAEFVNLVVRDWVQVGAVSEGVTYSNGTPQQVNDSQAITVQSLGQFALGQFWQIAVMFDRRIRTKHEYSGEDKTGNYEGTLWSRTKVVLQWRTKSGGVWTSWTDIHDFGVGLTSSEWDREEIVVSKMGAHDDVEVRLMVYITDFLEGQSTGSNPSTTVITHYNNIDNVSIVARALVR